STPGVPGSTTLDPPRSPTEGPHGRTDDLQLLDHPLAKLLREPPEQRRAEELELCRPRGRAGLDDEDARVERQRSRMLSDLVAHDLAPPTDDATDRDVLRPASLREQTPDDIAEELRIPAPGPRPGPLLGERRPCRHARPRATLACRSASPVEGFLGHLLRRR